MQRSQGVQRHTRQASYTTQHDSYQTRQGSFEKQLWRPLQAAMKCTLIAAAAVYHCLRTWRAGRIPALNDKKSVPVIKK